jgi:hypothetical protein
MLASSCEGKSPAVWEISFHLFFSASRRACVVVSRTKNQSLTLFYEIMPIFIDLPFRWNIIIRLWQRRVPRCGFWALRQRIEEIADYSRLAISCCHLKEVLRRGSGLRIGFLRLIKKGGQLIELPSRARVYKARSQLVFCLAYGVGSYSNKRDTRREEYLLPPVAIA